MPEAVILVCPCCASTVEAHARDELQEFDCTGCGQQWLMVVDADRQAEHALT